MHIRFTLLFALLLAGCSAPAVQVQQPNENNVYQIVVTHLAQQDSNIGRFVGSEVWISPKFADGDSIGLSWGDEIHIDSELIESLKTASHSKILFPDEKTFGTSGRVKKIQSFHDLYYYGDNMKDVDAKCVIEFYRPGFSLDGNACVVRFHYGPTAHGAAGTYILKRENGKWRIVDSTISYYV